MSTEIFATELTQAPIVIDTNESTDRFRARVYQMPSGTIVTIPIKEGSRGPLYTEQLTSTKHGKLRTTTKHFTCRSTSPSLRGSTMRGAAWRRRSIISSNT